MVRVGERVPGLDAEKRLVRARVFVPEVVDVAGGDERQAGRPRDLREGGVDPLLHLEAGVLDLQVDGLAPEDVDEARHLRLGLGSLPVLERLGDPAREAAGESDDPLPVRREQVPVDARLVVVALEEAGRGELDQVRVALVGLGQQRQVRVALPLRQPVVGDVDLAAEQRLDALLARLAVELDRAGEAPVVRERHRRHLQLGRPSGQLGDPAGPVEDRVLRVDVEVDEGRAGHRVSHLRPAGGHQPPPELGYLPMAKQISKSDKTSLVIDRAKVEEAREILGTTTIADTVDAALQDVIDFAKRRRLMERIVRDGGIGPSPDELRRLREP